MPEAHRVHSRHLGYYRHMVEVTRTVTTRELRADLSDVIGRVRYGQQRIGITRNGRLAAVLVSVEDLEDLEAAEQHMDAHDLEQISANRTHGEARHSHQQILADLEADLAALRAEDAP